MKSSLRLLLAVSFGLALAGLARAGDISGKWQSEFDSQIGVQKYTYDFHVDGTTVTGKAINEHGEAAIQDGKIDGDTITFVEIFSFNGMDIKITYTGKINGDEIKFTRQVGDFATEELTAKRVK